LAAVLLVLPSILVMWDRRQEGQGRMLPDVPFTFLAEFGHRVRRHRYFVLAGFLAVTVMFAYFMPRVGLDQNYMNALPQNMASLEAQQRILDKFGQSNEFVSFFARDMEEAEQIRLLAEEAGTVGEVISPSQLIPEDQDEKRVHLEAFSDRLTAMAPEQTPTRHDYDEEEMAELKRRFAEIKTSALMMSVASSALYGEQVRDTLGQVRDALNRIDTHLRPLPEEIERLTYLDSLLAVEIDDTYQLFVRMSENTRVTPDDMPPYMRDRLHGQDGSWMVLVRAEGDVWDLDVRKGFMEDVKRISGNHAGLIPSFDRMLAMIVHDIPRIVGLILAIVFVLVLSDLRSIKGTLLAMVPLIVGMVWTFGVLGILGMSMNMVSVLAVPIIVGIGIDDGVHLYHRIRKEGHVGAALSHSGKAVILTSMTTGIGFGSLLLSIHPGMFSLGATTSIGIISCLLVSLCLLPALVAIFQEEILEPSPDQPAE
ncbi:MAG: MMPL family transporter, partial [Myxococcota bacterium]|nr:MMPL family transporter [Myxococcota bacterium]